MNELEIHHRKRVKFPLAPPLPLSAGDWKRADRIGCFRFCTTAATTTERWQPWATTPARGGRRAAACAAWTPKRRTFRNRTTRRSHRVGWSSTATSWWVKSASATRCCPRSTRRWKAPSLSGCTWVADHLGAILSYILVLNTHTKFLVGNERKP